jgi:protein involved in polysaccharide export with SLBB domain
MGQVQRPGTYEYPTSDPLNLLQAIAAAGGYTRLAAPGSAA